jgi:hypothetical protein
MRSVMLVIVFLFATSAIAEKNLTPVAKDHSQMRIHLKKKWPTANMCRIDLNECCCWLGKSWGCAGHDWCTRNGGSCGAFGC